MERIGIAVVFVLRAFHAVPSEQGRRQEVKCWERKGSASVCSIQITPCRVVRIYIQETGKAQSFRSVRMSVCIRVHKLYCIDVVVGFSCNLFIYFYFYFFRTIFILYIPQLTEFSNSCAAKTSLRCRGCHVKFSDIIASIRTNISTPCSVGYQAVSGCLGTNKQTWLLRKPSKLNPQNLQTIINSYISTKERGKKKSGKWNRTSVTQPRY